MNDIKQKVIAVAKVDVAFFNYFFSLGIYYDCVSICLFFFFVRKRAVWIMNFLFIVKFHLFTHTIGKKKKENNY